MDTLTPDPQGGQLHEQLRAVKQQLRLAMNGVASQSMRQKGLLYKINFGVELPRLKQIAATFPKEHHLAQALWKEEIRECKILATMLQPVESFLPEIADIWVERIPTQEMAEIASMYLFQHLPYAPQKSLQWMASEDEMTQACGLLTAARLLQQKGDLTERVENELLDQGIAAFLSGPYVVRSAASALLRRYMQHSDAHAFTLCRRVECMKNSPKEAEQLLYQLVASEVDPFFAK
ncbi:MAG: DNA alkylation repair protein [Bacteroides sp.]